MTFPGGPLNPGLQNNLRTKYEQCGKNLMLYFGLIDERMNHSGNKQPVTKSRLTCKPTLESSEVEAFSQWSKWPKFVSLHYWHAPRAPAGVTGVSKIRTTELKPTQMNWSAKIQPKLKKLWKNCQNWTKIVKKPCFLKVFWILFNLGCILALQLTKVVFSLVFLIFLTTLAPLGACQ